MTRIFPVDRADAKVLARKLLEAAGPERHDDVRTVSEGSLALAFDVPDDLAQAVLGMERVEDREVIVDPPAAGAEPPAAPVAETEPLAAATAGGSDASADDGDGSSGQSTAPRARARRGSTT